MNKFFVAAAMAVIALLAYGVGVYFPLVSSTASEEAASAGADLERKPLYWVAPMDASFRRDKPGKSPMGMDLVPVYANDKSASPGDVRIDPQVQQNLGLRTAVAHYTTLTSPLTAVGLVSFNQQTLRHFHLRATGWVSELSVVAKGDPVSKGQKLFEFYSPEILNTQQEYLSALRGNHAALARSALLKLKAQGVSEREITAITRERKLRPQLSYYADHDGYVADISISNGSYVELEQNTLSVGTLDDVWVIAEVFERSAGLLQQGQSVTLTSRAYPGKQWQGEIDYVYPVLNPANRTVKVRTVIPNRDAILKPNMLVDLTIAAIATPNTLVVPTSAVIRTGQSSRVVRQISAEVYRSSEVQVGRTAGDMTAILDGLEEGDRVVVNAQFLIDSESNIDTELARIGKHKQGDGRAEKKLPHAKMPKNTNHEGMNHEGMNHEGMNHEGMHHEGMNHDDMNHEGMGHKTTQKNSTDIHPMVHASSASKHQQVAP